MLTPMNAAQVIEEIDALPAKEQEKVIVHVHQLQEALCITKSRYALPKSVLKTLKMD